jgi:hypothetical protein
MSFLLCPLCGKNSSLRLLDPESFDDDILAQEVEGLGKGKGFRTTGRVSILHSSEVRDRIVPRLIVLLKLAIDEDVISADEVRSKLDLPDVEEAVETEEDETSALQEERETKDQAIDEIINQIAEALGEDPSSYEPGNGDDGEDEMIAKLRYWVERFIDGYMAVKAENENLGDA